MPVPPRLFDRALLAKRYLRAQSTLAQADFLRRRVYEDMAETLLGINRNFTKVLDVSGRGEAYQALELPPSKLVKIDRGDLATCEAAFDLENLVATHNDYDLIISALGLHTVNDLPGSLIQIKNHLRDDGLFIGALFGGDTLIELRQCLMQAELEVRGGYGPRVAPILDSADMIDLLKRVGFAMPVVDRDVVKVTYENPLALMHDLRAMGETNIVYDRPKKGLNRAILERLFALYTECFCDHEGRIVATFEIITLSGWKPHDSQQKPLKPGTAQSRLADALGVKEVRL